MKVRIDMDDKHEGLSVTIHAKEWSEELEALVRMLNQPLSGRLLGSDEDQTIVLDPREIDYVFAENRKVFACSNKRKIELKNKLYEVESMLKPYRFSRFSKSVIGNLHRIDRFELAFNGNLRVFFRSGAKEYVSRQYVAELKNQLLGGISNGI